MAKKDFSQINTEARSATKGSVARSAIQSASMKGEQPPITEAEKAERLAEMRTQGRKGARAVRINMAFSPDNHEFIKVMASQTGRTMTETCNLIVQAFREAHPEMLERARAAVDELKAGGFADIPAKK